MTSYLFFVATAFLAVLNLIHGFSIQSQQRHHQPQSFFSRRGTSSIPSHDPFTTVLYAKKPKKNKKSPSNEKSGATGFGSPSKDSSGKVRSVSGFTGSGTKVLRVAANTFDKLRKEYGVKCSSDVYVRSPLHDKDVFWFVGKVARCIVGQDLEKAASIPTEDEAVLSQKRLILEYAKHQLRPQNFGGQYSKALELWLAPGDSEMDTVKNKITLKKVEGSVSDISDDFSVANVGFNPEIYVGDEVQKGGLRVIRDDQGRPTKPVFEENQSL